MHLYLKAFIVWMLIAFVEMIHGILRAKILAPKIGDFRSRQVGTFTGSLLIFTISFFAIPWLHPNGTSESLHIGLLWLICMVGFELSVGHFLFKYSWKWLLNDFNIFKGRLLLLGMLFLAICPYLVGRLRGIW